MSNLKKYLPKKKEKILVQAHLDSDIVEMADKYKAKHGISWTTLITAMLKQLEAENDTIVSTGVKRKSPLESEE